MGGTVVLRGARANVSDEMLVPALFVAKSVGACLNLGLSQAKVGLWCPQQSLQISAM